MHEDEAAQELRRLLSETATPETASHGGITVIGYDHTTITVHHGSVTSSVTTGRKRSASLIRRRSRG